MAITKWIPEKDPLILRRMGKTSEECSELIQVCSRIIVQGFDGIDPDTGISNVEALENELGDVIAQCYCTIQYLKLNEVKIAERSFKKVGFMDDWESMFRNV